jgi:hypothetical protein
MRGVFYPKRRFCQLLFLPVGREHDRQRQEDENAAQSADDVLDWHGMILIQHPTPALLSCPYQQLLHTFVITNQLDQIFLWIKYIQGAPMHPFMLHGLNFETKPLQSFHFRPIIRPIDCEGDVMK